MTRFILDVREKFDKLLRNLAKEKEITKSELIRRAPASYAYLDEKHTGGKRISVVDDATITVKAVVLP